MWKGGGDLSENLTAKEVFDRVKKGEPLFLEAAMLFGTYLGEALASVAAIVNPEAVVIGGGVSRAGTILFDFICPAYKKVAYEVNRDIAFHLAELGNDAGIYGAAKLSLDA